MTAYRSVLAQSRGWRPVQHELYGSAHLLVVVGVVTAGVVIFALALRHFSRRRGRAGQAFLSPTGYPLGGLVLTVGTP